MPTLAVPSEVRESSSCETWTQPPTFTFTLSDSTSDPSSVYYDRSELESASSSAGQELTETDGSVPTPRGHRQAWTIPSRLSQPSVIPQISISLSTLTFTRSSRSKTSPSTLLSHSPSTPAGLSSQELQQDREEALNRSTAPFPRERSPCSTYAANNKNNSLRHRIRAHTFDAAPPPSSCPLQAPRRSAFTSTAAFFTSMSRPSWDPFPLISSNSSHGHTHPSGTTGASLTPSTSTAPNPIAPNPNPISIEDARLLDPSYLSSIPLSSHSAYQNHSGLCIGSNGNGGTSYSHPIPYIDPQGTLHDPDYRPFPIIRQTKHLAPSPFAPRRPYWESDDDELDPDTLSHDGGDEGEGSAPNTPTSTTPFIYYFLETHSLKHGPRLRNTKSSPNLFGSNLDHGDIRTGRGGKWSKAAGVHGGCGTRGQLKLTPSHMYATIATGLGSRVQGYSPTTPTRANVVSPIPQYTSTISSSPPSMEELHPGKEKKGWGGLLWKAGKREGGDRD